jgi:hypothetical protein
MRLGVSPEEATRLLSEHPAIAQGEVEMRKSGRNAVLHWRGSPLELKVRFESDELGSRIRARFNRHASDYGSLLVPVFFVGGYAAIILLGMLLALSIGVGGWAWLGLAVSCPVAVGIYMFLRAGFSEHFGTRISTHGPALSELLGKTLGPHAVAGQLEDPFRAGKV